MASAENILSSLIESIKRLLGISKPEHEKLRDSIREWKDKRRTLHDEVDALKAEIRETQDQIRAKDAELKAAVADPETRPIIEEEIKSLFQRLDLKSRKRDIIFGGIDRMTNLIEQGENVLLGSSATTVTPETFMTMQLQMGEVLTQLREADRESSRLSTMQYHRPQTEVANLEQRKAAVTEPVEQTKAAAAEPQAPAQPISILSDEHQKRLERLRQSNTN